MILNSYDINKEYSKYLLDYNQDDELNELFSKFTINCQRDKELAHYLEDLRAGAIIYSAMSSNEYGATSTLSCECALYLDTEIIFDIYGLNGIEYQRQAEDFLSLVREVNKVNNIIKLKYFSDIENEIDIFFNSSRQFFINQKKYLAEKIATKILLKNVAQESDIIEKREELRHCLRKHNIEIHDTYLLYDQNQYKIKFKEDEIRHNLGLEDDYYNFRYIGYIDILRGNRQCKSFNDSGCIFITGTGNALKISHYIKEKDKLAPRATTLTKITAWLWLSLNKNFAAISLPKSFGMLVKARMSLSILTNEVLINQYKRIKSEVEEGKRDPEILRDVSYKLREYRVLPEEIDDTQISQLEKIISDANLDEYKTELEKSKGEIEEKEQLLYESQKAWKEEKKNIFKATEEKILQQKILNEKVLRISIEKQEINFKMESVLNNIKILEKEIEEAKEELCKQKVVIDNKQKIIFYILLVTYIILGCTFCNSHIVYMFFCCIIVLSFLRNIHNDQKLNMKNIINPFYVEINKSLVKYYSNGFSESKYQEMNNRLIDLRDEYNEFKNKLLDIENK